MQAALQASLRHFPCNYSNSFQHFCQSCKVEDDMCDVALSYFCNKASIGFFCIRVIARFQTPLSYRLVRKLNQHIQIHTSTVALTVDS